ncbi:MAG: hypothetical protein HXM47_03590 [Pseudoleptotrichia goodfellowii]|nr:hypothetical protein [Pseudoleptotrichia goodfellowii]
MRFGINDITHLIKRIRYENEKDIQNTIFKMLEYSNEGKWTNVHLNRKEKAIQVFNHEKIILEVTYKSDFRVDEIIEYTQKDGKNCKKIKYFIKKVLTFSKIKL